MIHSKSYLSGGMNDDVADDGWSRFGVGWFFRGRQAQRREFAEKFQVMTIRVNSRRRSLKLRPTGRKDERKEEERKKEIREERKRERRDERK